MKINIKKGPSTIILGLVGNLDIHSSVDFKNALEKHLQENSKELVLDMQELNYLDSSGVGSLLKALNYCKERKSTVSIANLQPAVEKIFKISGLVSYFELLSFESFQKKLVR